MSRRERLQALVTQVRLVDHRLPDEPLPRWALLLQLSHTHVLKLCASQEEAQAHAERLYAGRGQTREALVADLDAQQPDLRLDVPASRAVLSWQDADL